MLSLNELYHFVSAEIRKKKIKETPLDELKFLSQVLPSAIITNYPVIFDIDSPSFKKDQFEAFSAKRPTQARYAQALYVFYQANPGQINDLSQNCRAYLDANQKEIDIARMKQAAMNKVSRLNIKKSKALIDYLSAELYADPPFEKTLAWFILAALMTEEDELISLFNLYKELPTVEEKKAPLPTAAFIIFHDINEIFQKLNYYLVPAETPSAQKGFFKKNKQPVNRLMEMKANERKDFVTDLVFELTQQQYDLESRYKSEKDTFPPELQKPMENALALSGGIIKGLLKKGVESAPAELNLLKREIESLNNQLSA